MRGSARQSVERRLHRAAGAQTGPAARRARRAGGRPVAGSRISQPFAPGQRAALQRGHEAGADERRLAASGGAEHGEEACRLQLLEQPLHVGVAPEEELGVLLLERLEAAVRTDRRASGSIGTAGPSGMPLIAVTSAWNAALVVEAAPEVDPRARPQERREAGGVERLREPGEEDEEDPELEILRRAVERDRNLLVLPRAAVVRADEDRAGAGRGQALRQARLPVGAGYERPDVEPGLEPGTLQPLRDPLDDRLVGAVVRQEDVERAPLGVGRGDSRLVPQRDRLGQRDPPGGGGTAI